MTWDRTLKKALRRNGLPTEFKAWSTIKNDRPRWRSLTRASPTPSPAKPSHAQSSYAQPLHAQPSHAQPSTARPFPQLPPALSALTPAVAMRLTTEENTSDVFSK